MLTIVLLSKEDDTESPRPAAVGQLAHLNLQGSANMEGFAKTRRACAGVPKMRTTVFWGL